MNRVFRAGTGWGAPLQSAMRNVQQKLSIARGERPAELLFKNARVVNVFSGEIHQPHGTVTDDKLTPALIRPSGGLMFERPIPEWK